jgi:hypothetical protein
MAATVDGTFRLIDKASGTLEKMERRAAKLDVALKSVGDKLDAVQRKLDDTTVHAKGLNSELDRLSRQRVTPKIDLQGVVKAIAQIEALKKAKAGLDENLRRNSRAGGEVSRFRTALGTLGKVVGGVAGGILGMATAFGPLVTVVAALSPLILSLAGAVTALAGSLASAIGGAAVLGGGGLTMFAVGIGSVVAVVKSALNPLKDYRKAVDSLNKAQESGDPAKIKEAAEAVNRLAGQTPGIARFNTELEKTSKAFKGMVGDRGRGAFYGFASGGLRTLRVLMKTFREDLDNNAKAFFDSFDPIFKFLRGDEFQGFVHIMSRTWQRSIGPIMEGLLGYGKGLMRIFRSTAPYLREMARSFADSGKAFAGAASSHAMEWVDHMVQSFKDWWGLIKATGRLLGALFSAGRASGDSLVVSLTKTFDKWTTWLNDNPGKVQAFFAQAIEDTRNLASALVEIVDALKSILDFIRPVTNAFVGLGATGPAGILGGILAYKGVRGAMKGARVGGRLAGGAAAGGAGGGGAGGGPGFFGRAAQYRGTGGGTSWREAFGASYQDTALGRYRAGGGLRSRAGATMLRPFGMAEGRPGLFTGVRGSAMLRPGLGAAGIATAVGGNYLGSKVGGRGGAALSGAASGAGLGMFLGPEGAAAGAVIGGLLGAVTHHDARADTPHVSGREAAAYGAQAGALYGQTDSYSGLVRRQHDLERTLNTGHYTQPNRAAQRGVTALRSRINEIPQGSILRGPLERQLRNLQAKVRPRITAADRKRYEAELAAIDTAHDARRRARTTHSRARGGAIGADIQQGYQNLVAHGASPAQAMASVEKETFRRMDKLKPSGAKRLMDTMDVWARGMAKKNPALAKPVDDMASHFDKQLAGMHDNAARIGGNITESLSGQWADLRKKLRTSSEHMKQDFSGALTDTQTKALAVLRAMGLSAAQARQVMGGASVGAVRNASNAHAVQGGATHGGAGASRGPRARNARGGIIPGAGLMDRRMGPGMEAAPGEAWIANRHTMGRVNSMLAPYGTTLQHEITHEGRPHAEPVKRRARGGLAPGISGAVNRVLGHFPGLSVTSTTGGGHAAGSYHYRGMAADLGGAPEVMNQAAAWIKRTMGHNLTEGIHNPNLSIKGGKTVSPGFWGSTVWGQHANHIHLAVAGALGALSGVGGGGVAAPRLRARNLRGIGVVGAANQQGANAQVRVANARIQDAAAALGGGSATGGGDAKFMGSAGFYSKRRLMNLWTRAGGSPDVSNLMAAIALAESGGNPRAHNPSGATGLWQILGNPFPGNAYNPMTNAKMAVSKYRSQGLGAWEAYTKGMHTKYLSHGGQAPAFGGWFGDGGSFTADRPTYIGVGERGKEKVTVTPHRAGGGGGRAVHVEKVVVYGNEDTKRAVLDAFRDLSSELRGGDDDG